MMKPGCRFSDELKCGKGSGFIAKNEIIHTQSVSMKTMRRSTRGMDRKARVTMNIRSMKLRPRYNAPRAEYQMMSVHESIDRTSINNIKRDFLVNNRKTKIRQRNLLLTDLSHF